MLTVAIRGPLAAKMRELAESTGLSLAKLLGDMVLTYPGEVDAGYVPGTFPANWRVEHPSRSGAPSGYGVRRFDSGARVAVIGTVLARGSRVKVRCIGGKGRRAAAVEVAAE